MKPPILYIAATDEEKVFLGNNSQQTNVHVQIHICMHTHKFANIHVVRRITNARAGNLYLILILLSVAMPSMSEIRRPGRAEKKEHVEEEEKL